MHLESPSSVMHLIVFYGLAASAVSVVYAFCTVVYRLFFHPLAKIPGPKLAAATQLYEFYFDILKWPGGQYWSEVEKMHEKYGPIVRVTPFEIHIKDYEWYDQLYCNANEGARDKYPPAAHMTGTPHGIFGTVDHRVHRSRRSAISGFFSKRAVLDVEPWIHERCHTLCNTFRRQQRQTGSVELRVNFLALTTDVIAAHALNGSNPQNTLHLLKNDENAKEWQKSIAALAFLTPLVKQFPWLIPVALKLPVGFWMSTLPSLGRVVRLNRDMCRSAESAIHEYASHSEAGNKEARSTVKRHNIFHTVLKSNLPAPEKLPKRLGQEGFVAIAAGGETCGRMLTNGVYYTIANKERVWSQLKEELWQVMPTLEVQPDLKALEQLPYLTAIIKETLRLSGLLTSRLPLVAPYQALSYKDFVIPPGSPVSMSIRDILHNPAIFPEPFEFRPERWLASNPDLEFISRYYVPFSRGTRNCIGINMAYAQLYIVLASVFRRFEIDIQSVDFERDVEASRDCFIGEPRLDSPGVCVIVKERSE